MSLTVRCPAKVNLFLSVGPVDPSGYHPIRTVFQAVSLLDTLHLEESSKDQFCCDSDDVPADNTVTQAWRLAREYVGLPTLRVRLVKAIPTKSGLGGGSSDAAGLLRGLVHLTKGRFSTVEAAEVARAVGSDVPYFLVGGLARGEGYGERLTSLPDHEPQHLVVAMPNDEVGTASAYAALDRLPRTLREFPIDPFEPDNDFLRVAPPASLDALEALKAVGGQRAGLTGSGAAVFAVYPSEEAARVAAQTLDKPGGLRAWPCRTLTREESLWTS